MNLTNKEGTTKMTGYEELKAEWEVLAPILEGLDAVDDYINVDAKSFTLDKEGNKEYYVAAFNESRDEDVELLLSHIKNIGVVAVEQDHGQGMMVVGQYALSMK
ncbi:hypothetical protein [Paenibacillus sp. QZ-Y1]|uniref:hypothetical protein n=1 Tax=Paenibacillus sp. QZ-Y1 TaxID=3414511 RepID=UPI003F7B3382